MKRTIALILIMSIVFTTPLYAATRRKKSLDEYKVNKSSLSNNKAVKSTDTDDLHIYSNTYGKQKKYTKFSYDEFKIDGMETESTDNTGFDELHIPTQYQDDVWQPEEPVMRMSIDEIRLPNEMD